MFRQIARPWVSILIVKYALNFEGELTTVLY